LSAPPGEEMPPLFEEVLEELKPFALRFGLKPRMENVLEAARKAADNGEPSTAIVLLMVAISPGRKYSFWLHPLDAKPESVLVLPPSQAEKLEPGLKDTWITLISYSRGGEADLVGFKFKLIDRDWMASPMGAMELGRVVRALKEKWPQMQAESGAQTAPQAGEPKAEPEPEVKEEGEELPFEDTVEEPDLEGGFEE